MCVSVIVRNVLSVFSIDKWVGGTDCRLILGKMLDTATNHKPLYVLSVLLFIELYSVEMLVLYFFLSDVKFQTKGYGIF